MATTNEDATILASLRFADGRLLMARQLSDRGTIEFGFWQAGGGSVEQRPAALEIVAEGEEAAALADLCDEARARDWAETPDGQEIARSPELNEGATLVARRDGPGLSVSREPEAANRLQLDREAFERLLDELLPAVKAKLAALGPAVP